MRDILSKVMTGSMIAGAALLVAACGSGNETNNTAIDNTLGTEPFANDLGTNVDMGNFGDTGNVGGVDANVSVNTGADANMSGNASNGM